MLNTDLCFHPKNQRLEINSKSLTSDRQPHKPGQASLIPLLYAVLICVIPVYDSSRQVVKQSSVSVLIYGFKATNSL